MRNLNRDYFENHYGVEAEFLSDVSELMKSQKWVEMPIRSMQIKNLPDVPMLIGTDDMMLDGVTVTEHEAISETMSHIGLILETAGENYLMRASAYDSLLQRASISGRSIHRFFQEKKHVFIDFINQCMEMYGEQAQCLVRGGRIAGILSRDYCRLDQTILFEGAFKKLADRFGQYDFKEGLIAEEYTSCILELNPSKEMYVCLEKQMQKWGANEIIPTVRLTTSDLGKSHARLTPQLKTEKGQMIGYGKPLDVKHIGKKTEDDFIQLVEVVYPLFNETVARIQELENETFYYPKTILTELFKKYKVSQKIANLTIEKMVEMEGEGSINGASLYYAMCDTLDVARLDGIKGLELLFLEDTIGKMLLDSWVKYDYPENK